MASSTLQEVAPSAQDTADLETDIDALETILTVTDKQVVFGNGTTVEGDANLTYVKATHVLTTGTVQAAFKSSDGTAGMTGTLTTASLVGKTVTIKNGLITSIA